MNAEKLQKLQAQVRLGGKGTQRRKKKVVHRTATTDDKKLQSSLKKLSVNNIPGIEEVNMIKDDGSVIHFNNPKVQASLAANTFAVTGHAENKQITELLPGILNQLGAESLTHLKKLASNVTGGGAGSGLDGAGGADDDDDDDVPDLVENFDEVSKNEANVAASRVEEEDDAAEAADDEDDEKSSPSALPAGPTEEKKEVEEPKTVVVEEPKTDSKPAKKEGFYLPMPEEDELGFDSVEGLGDLDSSDDDGKDVETKINVSDSVVVAPETLSINEDKDASTKL